MRSLAWRVNKAVPEKVIIPTKYLTTTAVKSTSTSTGTFIQSQFMTDFSNPMPSSINTDSAHAIATALAMKFGDLSGTPCVKASIDKCYYKYEDVFVSKGSPCPKPPTLPSNCTPCVKRTIVNCIYEYEDLPLGSDCPPIPAMPASCGGGGAVASSTTSPAPAKSMILIVWHVPPVTGPVWYQFYAKPSNYKDSLGDKCGNVVDNSIIPQVTTPDPKQGRVDKHRPKEGLTREAPGKIGPGMKIAGKSNCAYQEDKLGEGEITCDGNFKVTCKPPTNELAAKIAPDNGACADIKNVFNLIMVSTSSQMPSVRRNIV